MTTLPSPARRTPLAARGITLVEALCVLTIVAVVACLAVPGWHALMASRRLDIAAATLAADLRLARVLAMSLGEPVRWTAHADPAGSCYLVHRGAASSCRCSSAGASSCADGAAPARSRALPDADRVRLRGNVASIVFEPHLGSATPTGTLQLEGADGRVVHCIVNLMGRVRLCAPSGAMPAYRRC